MSIIDADALKRKVQRLATQAWKMQVKASVETILNQFIDDIDHAPTVDAVEVVRCGDCKYWDTIAGSTFAPMHHQCKVIRLMTTGTWYCPSGERKDGDT